MITTKFLDPIDGRWSRAISLASLDVALPFYPIMGLRVENPIGLRDGLRDYIRDYRKKYYAGEINRIALGDAGVASFLKSKLDERGATRFEYWVTHLYCEGPREHGDLQDWTLVLRAARRSEERWRLLVPTRLRDEARRRFNDSTRMDEYGEICDRVFEGPLSDWDLHLYAINLWNDEASDCPDGPQSQIYPIAAAARGYAFWGWFLSQLSNPELETLQSAAQRLVESIDELEFIGMISSPLALMLNQA